MRVSHNAGFSLVELAMGLLIIGLLVAGVLQGQEIVKNAKISHTISQANKYFKAINSFENVYGGLPGDFSKAQREIPGCAENIMCEDGDGNGLINEIDGDGGDWVIWSNSNIARDAPESVQFWKHLALAEFIDDVDVDFSGNGFAWGVSHPKASIGGGYEFFYDSLNSLGRALHFFRISRSGLQPSGDVSRLYIATPLMASQIDRKADDGLAYQGRFLVNYGLGVDDCHNIDIYLTQNTDDVCVLFFVSRN